MTVASIEWDGTPLRVARPASEPVSAVLVLHQAPGYTPQTEAWLELLAERGYLAIAPLLLHRRGVEVINPAERFGGNLQEFSAFLSGDQDLLSDLDAALSFAKDQGIPESSVGVVGFSYGGRAAYLLATQRQLAGAVGFYAVGVQRFAFDGNNHLPPIADRSLSTPWLGLLGEADMLYSPGELDQWDAAITSSTVPAENVRYAGAGHAFDMDQPLGPGMPNPYHAEAAEDAQRRALAFLESHVPASVA